MTFPDAEAKALEGLLKAATPGPWSIDHRLSDSTIQGALEPGCGNYAAIIASEQGMRTDAPRFSANAALIVAMRNSIERLLSDRTRLREERGLRVGDRVRVLWRNLPEDWRYDWQGASGEGVEGFITGVKYSPTLGLDYDFADCWPAKNGDISDGWHGEWFERIDNAALAPAGEGK